VKYRSWENGQNVSILVLLDSWAKTYNRKEIHGNQIQVSILVLLDSWAKTRYPAPTAAAGPGFNPCFVGFMG